MCVMITPFGCKFGGIFAKMRFVNFADGENIYKSIPQKQGLIVLTQ